MLQYIENIMCIKMRTTLMLLHLDMIGCPQGVEYVGLILELDQVQKLCLTRNGLDDYDAKTMILL